MIVINADDPVVEVNRSVVVDPDELISSYVAGKIVMEHSFCWTIDLMNIVPEVALYLEYH